MGLVRVKRKHHTGYRYQQYQITDDIENPQGDRLYFLLEVSGSRINPIPLPRRDPNRNSKYRDIGIRSWLLANSCRTLWVVQNHALYPGSISKGTAFGYDLELVSANAHTLEHSFHPSVIPAAKEAIKEYAAQAYKAEEHVE